MSDITIYLAVLRLYTSATSHNRARAQYADLKIDHLALFCMIRLICMKG